MLKLNNIIPAGGGQEGARKAGNSNYAVLSRLENRGRATTAVSVIRLFRDREVGVGVDAGDDPDDVVHLLLGEHAAGTMMMIISERLTI